MDVLEFMIPLALILGGCGLAFFVWTIATRQYDDIEGAAQRILIDEDAPSPRKDSGVSAASSAAPVSDVSSETSKT